MKFTTVSASGGHTVAIDEAGRCWLLDYDMRMEGTMLVRDFFWRELPPHPASTSQSPTVPAAGGDHEGEPRG